MKYGILLTAMIMINKKKDTLRTKMYRKSGPFQSCEVIDDKIWNKSE